MVPAIGIVTVTWSRGGGGNLNGGSDGSAGAALADDDDADADADALGAVDAIGSGDGAAGGVVLGAGVTGVVEGGGPSVRGDGPHAAAAAIASAHVTRRLFIGPILSDWIHGRDEQRAKRFGHQR